MVYTEVTHCSNHRQAVTANWHGTTVV